jgi:hypothetical protein
VAAARAALADRREELQARIAAVSTELVRSAPPPHPPTALLVVAGATNWAEGLAPSLSLSLGAFLCLCVYLSLCMMIVW